MTFKVMKKMDELKKMFIVLLTAWICEHATCQPAQAWFRSSQDELKKTLSLTPNNNIAKNVILFIGDGMGLTTVTAARILKGQLQGKTGEETVLEFEKFPHVALSKTYLIDRQTAESAATATALMSGFKTKWYLVGMDGNGVFEDCTTVESSKQETILDWSQKEGKSTGVVTTARITHATPASAYAHIPQRNWEGDVKLINVSGGCKDIAYQLVHENENIEVLFGGGRRWFLPNTVTDPETGKIDGYQRQDGANLIEMWKLNKEERNLNYKYVWNKQGFDSIDVDKVDHVLGLFNPSAMQFESERDKGPMGEPSLAEMTSKAIKILSKNENGFFLMVEGALIDTAHHDGMAQKALRDTIAFEEAVQAAVNLTNEQDTLIIVTADHSHVFTVGGYPKRGNDILGIVDPIRYDDYPLDGKPFTTLMYSNGPGYNLTDGERSNPAKEDTHDLNYLYQSGVPLDSETHGGEDVAIYARGPMSHLIKGVKEQHYVAHVMAYASCVGVNKDHCKRNPINYGTQILHSKLILILSLFLILCR